LNYVREHVLRSLITGDARLKENETSIPIGRFEPDESDDEEAAFQKWALPVVEAYFGEEIDYQTIMSRAEEAVKEDAVMETIFVGQCCDLKPREIMEQFNISKQDFHNGKRRLGTTLLKIAKEYHLK
jgi:hypothetical protein